MTARHSKDPRNQVIGVLNARFTVNDIEHHFGFSRQTIHDLILTGTKVLRLSESVQDLVAHV